MSESAVWIPVYVGLGSNLDDPPLQLRRALLALQQLRQARLVAVSGFYRNPPMGHPGQPDYVNAVAALLTRQPAVEFLAALKDIERGQGRDRLREVRWGPRVIDLDLLMYGLARVHEPDLDLPHPGMHERNFVLFPLLEVAPGVVVPGLGPVATLAARLDDSQLERLPDGSGWRPGAETG